MRPAFDQQNQAGTTRYGIENLSTFRQNQDAAHSAVAVPAKHLACRRRAR